MDSDVLRLRTGTSLVTDITQVVAEFCRDRGDSERVARHPATHPRSVDIGVAIIARIPLGTPQPASGG